MDARTGLVIGGMTAVAASVAVVTAVALANTAALVDSEGTSVASKRVVVPAPASASATPRPTPAATSDALIPSAEPEVVEAPSPVHVAPPASTGKRTPATTEAVAPAAPAPPADIDAAIAAAEAAGTWDALRGWAAANGWSNARLEALIARLERENADQSEKQDLKSSSESSDSTAQRQSFVQVQAQAQAPAPAPVSAPEPELPAAEEKQSGQQSTGSQPPAQAGSNVAHGNGAGNDGKKDQSRNSPDKRD
ncbi:hypothetical protein [Microbacterium sp. LWH3-1.2]|uniref:hypothetical protein n=1 Tax=Microbacterium sp. LWH3-1.2 TaxID=3135256 RepID=UPI0034187E45